MSIRRAFTLIEVVVAVALLGIALASIVTMVSQSHARFMRAEQEWAREHSLTNAMEWYLLAGPDAAPPDALLPQGFSTECVLAPAENLPEMAANPVNGWIPAVFSVTVTNADGQIIGTRNTLKLVPQNEL